MLTKYLKKMPWLLFKRPRLRLHQMANNSFQPTR